MSHINNKKQKTKNKISNNTTNTLNHQDQSFGYLEWVIQTMVDYYK